MKRKEQTFASTIRLFENSYDLRTVFDDFLTMAICSLGQDPRIGKSIDEDLYMETVAKYKHDPLVGKFPEMFACLVAEMTDRMEGGDSYDVLGEFYEEHFSRKGSGQFFTPWPICVFMARSVVETGQEAGKEVPARRLRIIDPTCGSGRMLLAARIGGVKHQYYGVDIDHTCVKMAAVNLFLSGLFDAEVLCADSLLPGDFRVSYRTSFIPFGLFRVTDKGQSRLWRLLNDPNEKAEDAPTEPDPAAKYPDGSQLSIF